MRTKITNEHSLVVKKLVNSSSIQIRKKLGLTLVSFFVASTLMGCAGNKKSTSDEQLAKQGPDITRPPQTIGTQDRQVAEERNPDETISFDEWRKKRLEELKGN